MTDPSDDMLMALADDELSGDEATALRARIAADPALAARYAVFAGTRAALSGAFAPGPAPDRLVAAIRAAPAGGRVVPLGRRAGMAGSVPAGALAALAAALVLAVGAGGFLAGRQAAPGADPALLAAAELSALPTGATAALPGGGTARVLGSYRTDLGLCRLIDLGLPADRAERAVVCRGTGGSGWTVAAAVAAGEAEQYIPASDLAAEVIDRVLDDLGAGPALDPAAEAAALAP